MAQLGDTYTDPAGALQQRINDLTSEVTSSINSAPQVRQSMAQAIQQTPSAYQPESNERGDLVKALFEHDKVLGSRYSDPNNSMYIEDPAARDRATYAPEAPVLGAISTRNSNLQLLRSLFGDAIDRGMNIYQSGITAKQQQLDGLAKQMERLERDRAAAEDKRRYEQDFALRRSEAAKSGSGSAGGVDYAQVPVKTANGVEMQWAKVDRRSGNILEVLGRELTKSNDIATTIQKLKDMTTKQPTQQIRSLKDPKSGKIYSYEGTADPDYIEDIGRGFLPQ